MKSIARFTSKTQGHLVTQALLNQDIKSELIGSKDYSSIIVGSEEGRYELFVDWADEAEAKKILNSIQNEVLNSADEAKPSKKLALKKAIVFALLASVFLPVVFNYVSLKNLADYLKLESKASKRYLSLTLVLLLQIPSVIVVYMILKSIVTSIPK